MTKEKEEGRRKGVGGKEREKKKSYRMYLLTWRSLHQYGEDCSHR